MRLVRALALGLAAALASAAPPAFAQAPTPSPTADPRAAELAEQLEEMRARIANADEKEKELLAILDETEREISEMTRALDEINDRVEAGKKAIAADKAAIDALEAKIARRKRWLAGRLRSLYVHGRPGYLKILFASESYADLLRRSKYQTIVSRHDAEMVGSLKSDLAVVAEHRRNYELDLAEYERMQAESAKDVTALELERAKRRSLLEEVQSERMDMAKMARALEEAANRLDQHVGTLPSSSSAAAFVPKPFDGAKGKLLAPVSKVRIARAFGPYRHPRLGVQMLQQGIKYAAPIGTPVHAVWDGKVEMARWLSSYGQILIVDHGSGWRSLYAYNSKLLKKEGDFVKEGEVIAHSGDSGSLEGPQLFFAIYFEGKPVDPGEWLVTAQATAPTPAPASTPQQP